MQATNTHHHRHHQYHAIYPPIYPLPRPSHHGLEVPTTPTPRHLASPQALWLSSTHCRAHPTPGRARAPPTYPRLATLLHVYTVDQAKRSLQCGDHDRGAHPSQPSLPPHTDLAAHAKARQSRRPRLASRCRTLRITPRANTHATPHGRAGWMGREESACGRA